MVPPSRTEIAEKLLTSFYISPDPELVESIVMALQKAEERAELRKTIKQCPVCESAAFMKWEPVMSIVCSGGKCGIKLERAYADCPADHTSEGVLISRWNKLSRRNEVCQPQRMRGVDSRSPQDETCG